MERAGVRVGVRVGMWVWVCGWVVVCVYVCVYVCNCCKIAILHSGPCSRGGSVQTVTFAYIIVNIQIGLGLATTVYIYAP